MISTLQFLLSGLVAYLGIAAGLIISTLAKEELKQGRSYFVLLQEIVLLSIFLVTMRTQSISSSISVPLAVVLVILIQFRVFKSTPFVYPLLAIASLFAAGNSVGFFIVSSLIFIYGLAAAALQLDVRKKNYSRVLLANSGFIIMIAILSTFV
jgi:membrane-associated HD superfamily phosphohydrolase